jgi:hypothetical protein
MKLTHAVTERGPHLHRLGDCDCCISTHVRWRRPQVKQRKSKDTESAAKFARPKAPPAMFTRVERVIVKRLPCRGRRALECNHIGCGGHMRRIIVIEHGRARSQVAESTALGASLFAKVSTRRANDR